MKWRPDRSLGLGFGAGMIVASLILGVSPSAQPMPSSPSIALMKQLMEQKGYVVLTTRQLNDRLTATKAADSKSMAKGQRSSTASAKSVGQATPGATVTRSPAPSQVVWVAIQPGLSIDDITDLLYKSGVVKDRDAFLAVAVKSPHFVRAGVYSLQVGASPSETMTALTSP